MAVITVFKITGMRCAGCEAVVERTLAAVPGVISAKADYAGSTVTVEFDPAADGEARLLAACLAAGYRLEPAAADQPASTREKILSVLAFSALVLTLALARKSWPGLRVPELDSQAGYGLILLAGLLTGLHCVGMCGSFVLGYSADPAGQPGRAAIRPHLFYGAGKTLSYAVVGAAFGFAGSLFRITPLAAGLSLALAGLFMLLYGLSVLNVLPAFKLPRFGRIKAAAVYGSTACPKKPFFIGLLSGLILGCGPLQAMYVLAAGNGSALGGAKILALFGLGTLPALFAFGLLARTLTGVMARRFAQASGIILVLLGGMMLNKGYARANAAPAAAHSCCNGMSEGAK